MNQIKRKFYIISLILTFASFHIYAQEENGEDKTIDLPPVKIEIVDTTQLSIPKEKFNGFAKPEFDIYVMRGQKERLWYLTPTSVPERLAQKSDKPKDDFLFSAGVYPGIPASLTYDMLLVKGFGKIQTFLDLERSIMQSSRSAKLVSDPSKKQGKTSVDKFKGGLAYQSKTTNINTEFGYNAKDLPYLDLDGAKYPNERSLLDLALGWNQGFSGGGVQSSINISQLRMEGPFSSESGFDLKTGLDIRTYLPKLNPIDIGTGVEYFKGDGIEEIFKETLIRLYLKDNHISLWPFAIGAGLEFVLDAYKSSSDGKWNVDLYPNPYILLMSQLGSRLIFQIGMERLVAKSDLKGLYINNEYAAFNPGLRLERTWNVHASLKYSFLRKFSATVGVFDKDFSDMIFFEENQETVSRNRRLEDTIIYWMPKSLDSARVFGVSSILEMSLIDGKLIQKLDYTHELHRDNILYRPEDKGSLSIVYYAPYDIDISLSLGFCGPRYVNADENLSSYFLWKPKISKSFGKNAVASIELGLYSGSDEYQVWREYGLPDKTLDFGLMIKF